MTPRPENPKCFASAISSKKPIQLAKKNTFRSLVSEIFLKVWFWSLVIVLAVTVIGYRHVYRQAEADALTRLTAYVDARGRSESVLFRAAETHVDEFANRFLTAYADPAVLPEVDFDAYFFTDEHGATRLKPEYFDGAMDADGIVYSGVSAFIGNDVTEFSAEFRRRLVLGYKLVARYGPAWRNGFVNFGTSFPENAIVIYWPGGAWGLMAKPDLRMTEGSVIKAMLQSENPERRPVWTALYYDLTAEQWVVTYEVPVDLDGRHLVNPSFDVLLNDMMDRLISEHLPGSSNFIVSPDGHLIAHPNRMTGDKQDKGQIDIEETGDPVLIGMFESIRAAAPSPSDGKVWIADATEHDAFIAVAELAGPGWWFAAAYPKKLVAAEAHRSASVILILGVVLLVLLMTIVFVILRRDVARPLEVLKNASERITRGDESRVAEGGVPLPEYLRNEIGLLARSFRAMAVRVDGARRHLEAEVAERTEELREANRRLEELSLLDPLTGAHNRRALDHDLAAAVAQARRETQPFALLMCDVDLFKPFNDTYGHDMGDKVLREVVACLCKTVREGDRVYRYGGEEIAIILRGANIEDARWIAGRLVQRVGDLGVEHARSPYGKLTISIGVAVHDGGETTVGELVKAADSRLYAAKTKGRNTVVS